MTLIAHCRARLTMDELPEGADFNNPTCNVGKGMCGMANRGTLIGR